MAEAGEKASFQALYRACIKEAAAQGASLMQATLARALQDMPRQAAACDDLVERHLLAEAASLLRERQQALLDAFAPALLAGVAQAIAGERDSDLAFEALPLLAEDQLQDNMLLVRAGRQLEAAVQPAWQRAAALLAACQAGGEPQRQPLRPGVYLRSLYRAVRQHPLSPAPRRRWLQQLAQALAPELAARYEALAARLEAAGVRASTAPAARGSAASADRATQLTIRELQRLVVGADARDASARPAFADTGFSPTVPAAFEALREMQKVDRLLQELRLRQAAMPAAAADSRTAFRLALQRQASRPAQALALEVVHQMVEHLADDSRLLPPVREALRDLEPVLLRLALIDPRFFSDHAHPARQLLEQVTQRSLAWTDAGDAGCAEFVDGLQQAVDALLETRVAGAEAFEIALNTLQESWDDSQAAGQRTRERAVRALLRAEQRNLLAARLAQQLRQRPDAAAAPALALAFLSGPWAQVMAQARLVDSSGVEDPGGHGWVVRTLLWSVQPALAAAVAAQEAQLVARIQAGLATIDFNLGEAAQWLQQLATLRQAALAGQPAPDLPVPRLPETWLAPIEMHQAGFLAPEQVSGEAAADVPLPSIEPRVGAWVDLAGSEGWQRWRLAWASPHGLLLFTHASGVIRSMTRQRAQQLLADGQLRLVSARGAVDRALDAVTRAAWEQSERTEGGPQ